MAVPTQYPPQLIFLLKLKNVKPAKDDEKLENPEKERVVTGRRCWRVKTRLHVKDYLSQSRNVEDYRFGE
jgi:hypothetical protein